LSDDLNPPSLAASITAKGFSDAAGFRIVEVKTGYAELALARRDDLVQFFGLCAFGTAHMRALDLPTEFR
jgi:acyl-coenzyme A thioesterase PaaI-like protein